MAPNAHINHYLHNQYDGMDPEQLILALYKGALDRIKLTMEGIKENNIKKRGENLSKLIAIIAELNASIDSTMQDESTQFLRGLYNAMLMELPRVTLDNDPAILVRTRAYISRLKEIWENDVMARKHNTKPETIAKTDNHARQSLVNAFKTRIPETGFSAISV